MVFRPLGFVPKAPAVLDLPPRSAQAAWDVAPSSSGMAGWLAALALASALCLGLGLKQAAAQASPVKAPGDEPAAAANAPSRAAATSSGASDPAPLSFKALASYRTALFRPLSHEMRVPDFYALAPVRDRYGYIWMALKGSGAARLEGLRSRSFDGPLPLPDGKTLSLDWLELGLDAQGQLWAFSRSGGFARFNYLKQRFELQAVLSGATGFATSKSFVFDGEGNAWLMAVDGIWRVPAEGLRGESLTRAELVLPQRGVWKLDLLPSGEVLLAQKAEVILIDPRTREVRTRMPLPAAALNEVVPARPGAGVAALAFGPLRGEMAAAMPLNPDTPTTAPHIPLMLDAGESLAAALQLGSGEWVISTTGGALWSTPELGLPLRRLSPLEGTVHALPTAGYYSGMVRTLGRELWLSSRAALYVSRPDTPGLAHLQPRPEWAGVLDKLHARTVAHLLDAHTLMVMDDSPHQFSLIHMQGSQVQARRIRLSEGPGLLLGRSGARLASGDWVFSGNAVQYGLWRTGPHPDQAMRRLPGTENLQALSIRALGDGFVLASFRHELMWTPSPDQPPRPVFGAGHSGPLLPSYTGLWVPPRSTSRFWAYGPQGVIEVDVQTAQSRWLGLECLHRGTPCELGGVQTVMQDSQGRLWLETSRGLFRAASAGSLRLEPVLDAQGEPLAALGDMVEDGQGRIWTNLQDGLARISPDGQVTRFGTADDLPPGASQLLRLPDGSLLRVGRGALTLIDPSVFAPYPPDSPLNLNALRVDGQLRPFEDAIDLKAGERKFTLEWSVQDYADPSRNAIEYLLEGYEQAWTRLDASQAQISYENLSPGRYTLRLRGYNSRGDALAQGERRLTVDIQPFWYQTLTFKLAALAALLLAMGGAVRWRTARLRTRQAELKAQVRERTQALEESNQQISRLLSHVRQAIFSVDAQFQVSGAFSQSCTDIFGSSPSGQDVCALLCPDDPQAAASLRACLQDALAEPKLQRRALFTSLAPAECHRGGRVLHPEIVPLAQGFMFVVSDITEQRGLEQRITREQHRLELILSALSNSEEFFNLLHEFEAFIRKGQAACHTQDTAMPDVAAVYRAMHTFKGTMAQLGFHHLPHALHAAEDRLRDHAHWSAEARLVALREVFAQDWAAVLAQDLAPLNEVLGDDFFKQGGVVALRPEQADLIEQVVSEYLQNHPDAPPPVRLLARLRRIHLQAELRGHDKSLQRAAQQLGKALNPLRVEGDELALDSARWRPWLNSLVHLFRNAIDHGIEDPDTRFEAGKPEAGTLRCLLTRQATHFTLTVEDDGAGINEQALREAASRKGLCTPEQAKDWGLEALLFAEGLSSREQANEWSGRGLGMSLVRQETERLGGRIQVFNRPGAGCAFVLTLPLEPEAT
jgi:signal transduction histidine kinase